MIGKLAPSGFNPLHFLLLLQQLANLPTYVFSIA